MSKLSLWYNSRGHVKGQRLCPVSLAYQAVEFPDEFDVEEEEEAHGSQVHD